MAQDAGRLVTLALRHKPELLGIQIDNKGYCLVTELIASLKNKNIKADRELIEKIGQNERFSFNENHTKIRADYGNSLGLELSDMYDAPSEPPEILYHGTSLDALDSIKKQGIIRFAYNGNKPRDHVFMTEDKSVASRKGARHGKSVVLPIEARRMSEDGYLFYHAKLDIWLTDSIPREYIMFDYVAYGEQ